MENSETLSIANPDSNLRNAFHLNWVFSTISGITLLLFEPSFIHLFEINYPFAITGLQLLFFAGMVAFAAFNKKIFKGYTWSLV